ncbi:FAD-binding domain-containing protein [Hymenopellis radicata]|nr:FAD-binding domain-containing protein [Hymenopellis radicata]
MSLIQGPPRLDILQVLLTLSVSTLRASAKSCRNAPGDAGFPTEYAWSALNASIFGRLATVVPSGQFCKDHGGCTDAEWTSSTFRGDIPGAMDQVNWEQDYEAVPPQICFRDTTGNCAQGNVPLYAVLATTPEDVKAGIAFAEAYNLRVSVKASGHDYLGRSTARNSLLISTHLFRNISFHDDFQIGTNSKGSAVTVGSGVRLNLLYPAAKAQGKIVVGGAAATVVAAGGYIQAGGHSPLSPLFGLAADNVLQFTVVTGDAEIITVDETQNSDLFWALRGGGAGSWGVIVSATFRTFPAFNGTRSITVISTKGSNAFGNIMRLHAEHIFDMDDLHPAQYFFAARNASSESELNLLVSTYFPNVNAEDATAGMQPFLDDVVANEGIISAHSIKEMNFNDAVTSPDEDVGTNVFMGSRFFSEDVYLNSPHAIGRMYTKLFEAGSTSVLGHLVAGGQVSKNAYIDSAVHPKWRTAKTHIIADNPWADDTAPFEVQALKELFQKVQLPIMEEVIGTHAGSYSNEADSIEPHFQTTFYGPNYDRLSEIKSKYDPNDLFIVASGVGSERWEADGFCKVQGEGFHSGHSWTI